MKKNIYQSQYIRFFQLSSYLIPTRFLIPGNMDFERWNKWDKLENKYVSKL